VQRSLVAVAVLLSLGTLGVAHDARALPPQKKDWEVRIRPYAWLPAIDGSVDLPGGRTTHYNFDIKDVIEHLDVGAMGAVDVRWHRVVGTVDGVWSVLKESQTFGQDVIHVKGKFQQTMGLVQALGGYRVYRRPGGLFGTATADDERVFGLDVLAGINYTYLNADVELKRSGPFGSGQRHFGKSNDWVAPFVGLRVQNDFTDRLRLESLVGAGGFGVGDAPDVSWQVRSQLSYRFTDHFLVSLGYRRIVANDNKYDVTLQGPMLGIGYQF
jgi:hypothetical protein